MSNQSITNLELAKEYFFAMGCSHFHMAREYPDRYEEYRRLDVSKETEYMWRTECFQQLYNEFMGVECSDSIWGVHSSMEELAVTLNKDEFYEKMLMATQHALKTVPDGYRILIAETINGRQNHRYRPGLIYHSFDIGRHDLALEFSNLSIALAESERKNSSLLLAHCSLQRIGAAISDCKSIKKELGL